MSVAEDSPAGNEPTVSVVIVIDYKIGDGSDVNHLVPTLKGLAHQDYTGTTEFLLIEASGSSVPLEELRKYLSSINIVNNSGITSYDLKNAGCRSASSDLVVILDADCVPHPGWLSAAVNHHKMHKDAAAISGKTLYRKEGLLARVFALLDRSYVDCGRPGKTQAISNNNAAFRRDKLLKFPLKNDIGTFGSKMHSIEMLAAGEELRFEPDMIVYHNFYGWKMQKLDRRHIGYAMAKYRLAEEGASHGWMFKMGLAGLPVIYFMAVAGSLKRCLKRHAEYGVRWFEVPAAIIAAFIVHAFEIPGIVTALRGGKVAYGDGYV